MDAAPTPRPNPWYRWPLENDGERVSCVTLTFDHPPSTVGLRRMQEYLALWLSALEQDEARTALQVAQDAE